MIEKFKVEFLAEAVNFMEGLDKKARDKVYYNIRKAQVTQNPELFKTYYRLFAFWDKTGKEVTVVLATHGLIKKTDKTPKADLEKVERIRQQYFEQKKL